MASGQVLQTLYNRANSRTGLCNTVNKVKPIFYSQYFEFVAHDNRRKGLSALSGWILNKLLSSSTNLSSHIGSNFINTSGLGPLHIVPRFTFFLEKWKCHECLRNILTHPRRGTLGERLWWETIPTRVLFMENHDLVSFLSRVMGKTFPWSSWCQKCILQEVTLVQMNLWRVEHFFRMLLLDFFSPSFEIFKKFRNWPRDDQSSVSEGVHSNIKTVWKWMFLYKWPLYDLLWPFFCHVYLHLPQNWGSDGHFEELNKSNLWLVQNLWQKTQIFPFLFLLRFGKKQTFASFAFFVF